MRLLALTTLLAASVHAAPVTFHFSGQVTNVSGSIPTGAAIGDFVDGTGSFDPTSPDLDPDPDKYHSNWFTGPSFLQVNVHTAGGVLTFTGTTVDGVHLWDWDQAWYPWGDYMQYTAYGSSSSASINSQAGGPQEFTLWFLDGLAPYDMLDGITPPAGLPDLTKATSAQGFVRDNNSGYTIDFSVTSVPEPATGMAFLVAAGLLALSGRRTFR